MSEQIIQPRDKLPTVIGEWLEPIVQMQQPSDKLFVSDAIVEWSEHIRNSSLGKHTKVTYLTSMRKLLERHIVFEFSELSQINLTWLKETKAQIINVSEWSTETKDARKKALNSFFRFVHNDFNHETKPSQRRPVPDDMRCLFSNVLDQNLLKGQQISPVELCNAVSSYHPRDAYIVWIMFYTGQKLEDVLALRKEHLKYNCLSFVKANGEGFSISVYAHVSKALAELSLDNKKYLFETANGKKMRRTQIIRNLKRASQKIGLPFVLTPKTLHQYSNVYMPLELRAELESFISRASVAE